MKKLRKGQKGVTLVELVIVVALAGIVGAAITATAFQVFTFSTRLSNQMTAVRQVQQAGFWVSPDVMMALPDEVDTENDPDTPEFELLTLTWEEWGTTNKTHEVKYILVDMSGGLKILQREHYIDTSLNSTTTVAECIDPDPTKTSCDWDSVNDVLTLQVTATVGGQTETRVYEVKPRVGT